MTTNALTGSIFVTGGTGTLGQAFVARAHREHWDCQFTIYSRDEIKQQTMRWCFPHCHYILGDVADGDALEKAMAGHTTVLHLAAFKHIPAGELNPAMVWRTNVTGSQNVALTAMRLGVKTCLGISTDKACKPHNVYGASKMMMERLFQDYHHLGLTRFHLTRYGNVLVSTGSVIPVWKDQAKRGESLTVTDPCMTRFWLSVEQAVEIALLALTVMDGSVVIPVLPAMAMSEFVGAWVPDGTDFRITGLRPGEKRHEDLLSDLEGERATRHTTGAGLDYYLLPPVWAETKVGEPQAAFHSDIARQLTRAELVSLLP